MNDIIKNSKTIIMPKVETQRLLKLAVKAGLIKIKLNAGYELRTPTKKELVFKAMNGNNDYLCRFNTKVFE